MRRGGVGVGKFKAKKKDDAALQKVASALSDDRQKHADELLATFSEQLTAFAQKHRKEIRADPEFRREFQRMCDGLGVDVLASKRTFWSSMLGVGDFYYELAVRIVELSLAARAAGSGGLLSITELVHRLNGGATGAVSEDDVRRAIGKLRVLGNGFSLLTLAPGEPPLVMSVPMELNNDHASLLRLSSVDDGTPRGALAAATAARSLGWPRERVERALQRLLREGVLWIDDGDARRTEPLYWALSLWLEARIDGGGTLVALPDSKLAQVGS